MVLNKAIAALCLSSLAMNSYLIYQSNSLEELIHKNDIELKNESEKQLLFLAKQSIAEQPRIANIINHKIKQSGGNKLSPALVDFTIELTKEIKNDMLDDVYYRSLASAGYKDEVIKTEYGYNVRSTWDLFAAKNTPFYEKFPNDALWLFHNETIPILSCEEKDKQPRISYAPMSSTGDNFTVDFVEEEEANRSYRVTFKGNFNPIKDRVIINIQCFENPNTESAQLQ